MFNYALKSLRTAGHKAPDRVSLLGEAEHPDVKSQAAGPCKTRGHLHSSRADSNWQMSRQTHLRVSQLLHFWCRCGWAFAWIPSLPRSYWTIKQQVLQQPQGLPTRKADSTQTKIPCSPNSFSVYSLISILGAHWTAVSTRWHFYYLISHLFFTFVFLHCPKYRDSTFFHSMHPFVTNFAFYCLLLSGLPEWKTCSCILPNPLM